VFSVSRVRRVEVAAEAPAAGTGMITTSEDPGPEAEIEDAVGVETDITADGGAEVVTEGDHEAETAGGEAEVVAGQEAREGLAPGQGTGRGTIGDPRRGIQKRVAMAKKLLSRRKLLRMAAQRMGISRKDQNPRAGKEKGQSHVIGKGQDHDRARDPRDQDPEIAEDALGHVTEEGQDPGPGIGEDPGLGTTRVRRARGTGTRGRKSRETTIRKRLGTRTRRKKRPRQLTWRYPILHEEGKSAISDFSVAFYIHHTKL